MIKRSLGPKFQILNPKSRKIVSEKKVGKQIFWVKKCLAEKKFGAKIILIEEKTLGQHFFDWNQIWVENFHGKKFGPKRFWLKKIWVNNLVGEKKLGKKKKFQKKSFGPEKKIG